MSRITTSLVALLLSILASSAVSAHPGHSHRKREQPAQAAPTENDRAWSARTGAFRESGSFVMAREGLVQIRRPDESLVKLPVELLSDDDQTWVAQRMAKIRQIAEQQGLVVAEEHPQPFLLAQATARGGAAKGGPGHTPDMAQAFEPFTKLKAIKTRWDDKYFYVESNGIPDHQMMVGITAWQQQVPLPQKYVGENAWQIPLNPVPAKTPATTKNHFLRGAIALAVNGVPIFNPLNNRGDDAFLFGELDEFGGHCGRADDYHYHIAPVHLEKTIGKGQPIAYALDGYPIYGYEEPDGSPVKNLDALNGHKDEKGNYHYHASKTYPYLNGGFYGEVTERGDQVDPQPRAEPLRPDLRPLRDAKITDFKTTKDGNVLTYDVRGKKGSVTYRANDDGTFKFTFVDTNGKSTSESYTPRRRGGGDDRRPPRPGENRPPRRDDPPPPRDGDRPPRPGDPPPRPEEGKSKVDEVVKNPNLPELTVTSPAFKADGAYPVEFSCDGEGASPPIEWTGAPATTKSYALNLWHIPGPGEVKSYWVIYNIPATVTKLPKNSKEIGTIGSNGKNRREYDPMCSKGPGWKTYHLTVYALSADLKLTPDKANRAAILAAMKEITVAEGTLTYQFERKKN